MNDLTPRRARLRLLSVLTTLMLLIGTGAAAAYWTATATVTSTASAAKVSLEQTLLPADQTSPLAATYSAESPTTAGAVSLNNAGTREANYTLTVGAGSNSDLAAAIQVAVGTVGSAEECTPQAALENAQRGSLSDPFRFAGTGPLAAGQGALLCVQTSLAAADIAAFAEEEIGLTVSSSLSYANVEAWTREATAEFTQSVAPGSSGGVPMMTCEGVPPNYLELKFPPAADDLKWKLTYRAFLAHEDSPDERLEFKPKALSPYYSTVEVQYNSPELISLAEGGLGNTRVYVEQKLAGEETWELIAVGQIHTVGPDGGGELGVYCGWQ